MTTLPKVSKKEFESITKKTIDTHGELMLSYAGSVNGLQWLRAFADNVAGHEQTSEQIKTDAINEFVCSMIGTLESGFIDTNKLTLAELHRVAQNYCKDKYGVELPHIIEQWGEEIAALCGYSGDIKR